MVSLRSLVRSSMRLFLAGSVILFVLVISGRMVLGTGQQSSEERTAAANRTWPDGADLLAAQELTLPADTYQWQITSETTPADDDDAKNLETGPGIVIASSGPILVEINEVDTLRLEAGAALSLHDEDSILITSADDDPADYLVVELLTASDAASREDDGNQVGPLDVGAGEFTLALINLAAEQANDATIQDVSGDSIRPGVSIIHDEKGVPDQRDPNQKYDLWIVALFPVSTTAETQAPASGGNAGGLQATAVATTPAPPASPTATLPASPTVTATATGTPADTPTATPTSTPTDTPTVTPTTTPTATPTNTPTPTPTATPTNTPTPTMVPPTPTPEPTMIPTV